MESKDFLANFLGNLASGTVGAAVVIVNSVVKKITELKHSRENYGRFRKMLNERRFDLTEMQRSYSQYHTQVLPAVESCTKQLMAVLEDAETRFPEDPPSLVEGLTLHREMEGVKMKLEDGFKELDSILARQDLFSKTAFSQPPTPLMQPPPETGFVGDVIKTLEKRILELIRHDDSPRIIVLHGLCGVGKTTLLQKVYNSVIQESNGFGFYSKSWLTISQEYNIARLQRILAADVGMQVKDIEDEERLKMRLADSFKIRKFFVVLDDLWSENFDVRKLGLVFGEKNQGSKVVITTRNINIARKMGYAQFTKHIEVPTLNEGDSWEMFRLWSFGSLDTGYLSEEEIKIAKTVCKECKGLPLAIKPVAVSFSLHGCLAMQDSFLRQLRRAKLGSVESEQGELFNKLKLSYDSLPNSDLKKCFLYTARMFAEDEDIRLSKLISMWICEGFLECEDDYYSSIQRGIRYLKILYYQCLISISGGSYDLDDEHELLTHGIIKVHVWIRDMAMTVTKGDAFKSHPSSGGNFERLSLQRSFISELPSEFPHSNMISLNLSKIRINKVPNDFFTQLISLKVLDLSFTGIDSLPSSIFNLSSLELLNLYNCVRLGRLPEELGNLVKLRILDIGGTNIQMLPSSLGNLTALKDLRTSHYIKCVPKSIARLTSLEVLHIRCDKLTPHPSLFDFKDLTEFRKLQELELQCFSIELHENTEIDWTCWRQLKQLRLSVERGIPAVFSKIFENMVQLQRLMLQGTGTLLGVKIPPNIEELVVSRFSSLPNLENFQNLKVCKICNCSIQRLQIGKTIQKIFIGHCDDLEQLIWPDECCALKRLHVGECQSLKSVSIGQGAHPKCLEKVELYGLTNLEKLGEEQDHWNRDTFPALHTLDISRIESNENCRQSLENLKRNLSLE